MSKKTIYATITIGWAQLLLPIEQAHKLQLLIAEHALLVDSTYTPKFKDVTYIKDSEIPPVSVTRLPIYDTRGMSEEHRDAWLTAIRLADAETIIDPRAFSLLSE